MPGVRVAFKLKLAYCSLNCPSTSLLQPCAIIPQPEKKKKLKLGDSGVAQAQDWECNTGLYPSVNTRVDLGELSCPPHLPGSTWTMRTLASKKLPTPWVSDSKSSHPLPSPEPHGACSPPPAFTAQPSGSRHLPGTSWESSLGYSEGYSALCT